MGCREWALDEPEIANLSPDSELCGPGVSTTAGEVLDGVLTRAARSIDGQLSQADLAFIADQQSLISADLLDRYQTEVLLNESALVSLRRDDGISPWLLIALVLGTTGLATLAVARFTGRGEPS